jgi:hypothetical protein
MPAEAGLIDARSRGGGGAARPDWPVDPRPLEHPRRDHLHRGRLPIPRRRVGRRSCTDLPRAIRRRFACGPQRVPLRSRGLSSPKVRHCHDRAWSPPRADDPDRPRPIHDDPIALSISAPYPVAARLVVGPDDFRDVGVGNQRYDTVALSGNGVGSEIDGGHYKSSSGPRFRLRASGPGPPQRAPISGARLAAPFVEARRSDRREPGGCPWMRPLVVLSGLSGSCVGRLNNARSSGGEETIEQVE